MLLVSTNMIFIFYSLLPINNYIEELIYIFLIN